jgi:hypothetical protein
LQPIRIRAALFRDYPFLEERRPAASLRYAAASVDDELIGIHRVA